MAAAEDDVHFPTSSTVGNAGSFRMDYTTPSNVRLCGGDVGNFHNSRGGVTTVYDTVPNGKRSDQQTPNISLDESLLFHVELPIPVDDDMVPTLYQRDDVSWVVLRNDDDVWGHKDGEYDCGAVHSRNVDCATPEYSDDPRSYDNWKFWRSTTPPQDIDTTPHTTYQFPQNTPLPSKSEFYAGAAQSPQDIGTNTTTTTTDQFPHNMPTSVVSALKEVLNGESYTGWKQSAKANMNAMFEDAQARDRAARDLALCDAERRYRERTEGPTWEETQRRSKEDRRRRRRRGKRHASK